MPAKATKAKRRVDPSKIRKLHKLLKLGIVDLRNQERAKNSVVDMNHFLERIGGDCHACLAGSVLRFTCGKRTAKGRNETEWRWLEALEYLRLGGVSTAASCMWPDLDNFSRFNSFDRNMSDYEDNPTAFWRDIEQLHADLKAANI